MSDNKSILSKLSKDEDKDSILNRLYFANTILNNNVLEPMINFKNTDTECFINKSKDEDSGESYDTRATLKKKVHDITVVINKMGGTLVYMGSGTTGHTFKGIEMDEHGNIVYEYAVKVVAYPIKDRYGSMYDTRRPENAEIMMIKLLSYFIVKKKTPHIVLPIGTFDTNINNFTSLIEDGYVDKDNEKYKDFIARYKNGEYYNDVSILISEWANRGDLSDFIKKNYKKFTPLHWKSIFFQLISTLAVIQSKYPTFRHNDLKPNNVLITKTACDVLNYSYVVNGDSYRVRDIGYQIKIWDFDFACIPGLVDNKKVMISNKWSRGINVGITQNRYYDIHYFFNTLIKKGFFPELMYDPCVPQEVRDFVNSIVPLEYQRGDCVSKGGRILHNMEYVLPVDILRTNPYFEEFRVNPKNRVQNNRKNINSDHKIHDFLKRTDNPLRPMSQSIKNPNNTNNTNNTNNANNTNQQKQTNKNDRVISSNKIEEILCGTKQNKQNKPIMSKPKTFTKDSSDDIPKVNSNKQQTGKKTVNTSNNKIKAKSKSYSIERKKQNKKQKSKSISKSKPKQVRKNTTARVVKNKTQKSIDDIDIEEILIGKK